jgi:hypothetical protein
MGLGNRVIWAIVLGGLVVLSGTLASACDSDSSAASSTSGPPPSAASSTLPSDPTTTANTAATASTATTVPAQLADADLTAASLTARECFAKLAEGDPILSPVYKFAVELAIANGPGHPGANGAVKSSTSVSAAASDSGAESIVLALPAALSSTPTTIVQPGTTSATAAPVLKVAGPAKGKVLVAGAKYDLRWSYSTSPFTASPTFTVSLSTDKGKTYRRLATGLTGQRLTVTLPKKAYDQCYFQVETDPDPDSDASIVVTGRSGLFSIALKRQPNSKPVYPPKPAADLAYVKAGTFFIDKNVDGTRWFRLGNVDTHAKRLVWQLSGAPFSGLNSEALDPPGLLASGELDPGQSEFSLDFTKLVAAATSGQATLSGAAAHTVSYSPMKGPALLKQDRYSLYVRVIALNASGELIGDAGRGMTLGYGSPLVELAADTGIPGEAVGIIETWASRKGLPENLPTGTERVRQKAIYAYSEDKFWDFAFHSTPANTGRVDVQIATSPFGTNAGSYEQPAGLVWHTRWDGQFSPAVFDFRIPVHEFTDKVKATAAKPARYYIRAVFFKNTENPEVFHPVASETLVMYFVSSTRPVMMNTGVSLTGYRPTETITVKSGIPFTSFSYYRPAQFEAPDANRWFEVSRRIMADEMVLTVKTPNQVIYPYYTEYLNTGMSKAQYQALLDQVLPVGTCFPLTVNTDAASDFMDLLGDIYGSVKKAYDDFKTSLVSYVADNFPLLDSDTRDTLRSALDLALNAGLAAIGIPPTLPDFDVLAAEGFGYCLDVAIQQECQKYGVDPNTITNAMRKQLTDQFSAKMAELTRLKNVNPLGVGYLRPASSKQSRPASVTFIVQNFTDKVSPQGTLSASYSPLKGLMTFYRPLHAAIPPLQPHTYKIVTLYLQPDIPTPWGEPAYNKERYDHYYFGEGGTCRFSLTVKYDVPDAKVLAQPQGLIPTDPSPFLAYEYVYDHDPTYRFSYEGPPSEWNTGGDPAADPHGF